jgi:hypothetical protein
MLFFSLSICKKPGLPVTALRPLLTIFARLVLQNVRKKYGRFTHCTTRQASEDQQQFVVFCRGTHLFDDQKHQSCPGGGLERTHLPQIS